MRSTISRRICKRSKTFRLSSGELRHVIPGWSEGPDPESRDSGFASSMRPGMTTSWSARRRCRNVALALQCDFIDRAEMGFGRAHKGIRIGGLGGHRPALMGEPYRDF